VRRALSSTDDRDLLRAERDVVARMAELGVDVDLDFASMAVVANVFRVASTARGHLERTVLADVGLSFSAFTVMWVLWIWGEAETRDLAIDAGITKGTLTGVVGTLERRGLVGRRRASTDGRLVRVASTPAGDALMASVFARFNEGEARIVAALDDGEARQLAHLLRTILRSMDPEVADER
jgi:MarR family transcriptional regulator, organic hydroperoxide resistance regulator